MLWRKEQRELIQQIRDDNGIYVMHAQTLTRAPVPSKSNISEHSARLVSRATWFVKTKCETNCIDGKSNGKQSPTAKIIVNFSNYHLVTNHHLSIMLNRWIMIENESSGKWVFCVCFVLRASEWICSAFTFFRIFLALNCLCMHNNTHTCVICYAHCEK